MRITRRAAFAAALSATAAPALAQGSLRDRIVGAYTLGDAFAVHPDGSHGLWLGRPRPYTGLIVYSASGFMSVQIASARAEMATGANFDTLPAAERSAYLGAYEAYFGRYRIDEAKGEVHHLLTSAIAPGRAGADLMRRAKLVDNMLVLTTAPAADGGYTQLNWIRT